MHLRMRSLTVAPVLATALVTLAVPASAVAQTAVVPVGAPPVLAGPGAAQRSTLAVIGDVPYGTAQEATFGDLVQAVDADPQVRATVHVGDIKSGSTTCTDERFAAVRAAFDRFEDPLVYTPGDNEWTDCHRVNNGAYDPLERLGAVRRTFFPQPGRTLGRRVAGVEFQRELVENVRWFGSRTAFATVHVIGSDNGMAPWTGLDHTTPTPEQAAEVSARIAADVAWIDETFDAAERERLRGVALFMQADTWSPEPSPAQRAIVARLTERTARFGGQVLVVQGDSHVFTADDPLGLPNFRRVVVHGEALPFEYLRLTVDPRDPALFSWERHPVALAPAPAPAQAPAPA